MPNVKDLKKRAKNLKIKGYYKMKKEQLLDEIKEVEKRKLALVPIKHQKKKERVLAVSRLITTGFILSGVTVFLYWWYIIRPESWVEKLFSMVGM